MACYKAAFHSDHNTCDLLSLPEDTFYLCWLAILVSRPLLCLNFFHGVVVQCCRDQQAIYLLQLNAGCSLHINSKSVSAARNSEDMEQPGRQVMGCGLHKDST